MTYLQGSSRPLPPRRHAQSRNPVLFIRETKLPALRYLQLSYLPIYHPHQPHSRLPHFLRAVTSAIANLPSPPRKATFRLIEAHRRPSIPAFSLSSPDLRNGFLGYLVSSGHCLFEKEDHQGEFWGVWVREEMEARGRMCGTMDG